MILTVVLVRLFYAVYQFDQIGVKKVTAEYVSPSMIAATLVHHV